MKTSEMVYLIDKWHGTYMAGYPVTCEYIGYAGLGDRLGLCGWKDRKTFSIYVNKIFEKDCYGFEIEFQNQVIEYQLYIKMSQTETSPIGQN